MEFDLLFRWFVGLGVDDPVWDATTFSKNRDRLLQGDVASEFMRALLVQPKVKVLLSTEHFSVDGTLLEAWASTKGFRPKDGSGLAIHACDGGVQPGSPAEVAGGGSVTPGVCPERACRAKKSLKLAKFRRKKR